ncbi:MAG: HEAT repeat domain-containing protein [Planctomycetota bacterium]|nr:HEAT repeat domain-containing protein [Planctomycetota bacterium]
MIRIQSSLPLLFLLAVAPLLSAALPSAADDESDLKSKDATVRLAAVQRIAADKGEDAGKLLARALKDDDWEVVIHAANGLGELGHEKSLKDLAKLAWDGPIVGVRNAAALAAGRINSKAALKEIGKKLSGDRGLKASDAYGLIAFSLEDPTSPKALGKLLKAKDTLTRAAAARALVLTAGSERKEMLAELLQSEYIAVIAAALDAAQIDPQSEVADEIGAVLERPSITNVVERRAIAALAACVNKTAADAWTLKLCASANGAIAARGARFAKACATFEWFDPTSLESNLASALGSEAASVRAAAVHAMRFGPVETATGKLQQIAESDASARVRRAALASALELADAKDDGQRAWLKGRLSQEADGSVREDIAVALGVEGLDDVTATLVAALSDPDWGVAVCAAVSLGRTRASDGIDKLIELTQVEDNWRLRGAGVVGLCHAMQKEGISAIIECLADPEPLVARTAYGFLKSLSKYGYSMTPSEIYAGLDVMVFESRGDHIETVLDFIGLDYRKTSSNRVGEAALDAAGVFVSNCTGEMQGADVERLRWFVKCGGYLFGSCWAIHETIERVSPGAIRKLPTASEVMDQVTATPCSLGSPYLKGVFATGVVPIYNLVGAHLIEVLEPERVEVLVDSAECAERWGEGNLTAWFSDGHGRLLDSVNHFEAQGLAEAIGLKSPEDRMAYAIDHMGISFEKIRETRGEKWWSSNMKAANEIRDLSVFNLITNFVRARRIEGY